MDVECDLEQTGPHWVVSRNDPTGKCQLAEVSSFVEPNDTALPQLLMKRRAEDGTATMIATAGGAVATTVIFNSIGRISAGSIDTIDVANPSAGTCEHSGTAGSKMRCMRIRVGTGGQVKMCDPKVTVTTDSRYCQ
jgi:type IV fimbrial biogenesis protein FimT